MVLLERFLNLFCIHAAVVNTDPTALQQEVTLIKKTYGPWCRIWGFETFKEFFYTLHLKKKYYHFSIAFLHEADSSVGEKILKKVDPMVKTIKYVDAQQLSALLGHR
jgi:hypothetical protein